MRISFANEMANLCERVGAHIYDLTYAIGLDKRIGPHFLDAGLGWGGSCFGKDTAALQATGREYGISMSLVQAACEVNARQRLRVIEILRDQLKILKGRTIGILGMAFKPHTDDIRDSPAVTLVQQLLERGARVFCHDPQALANVRRFYPELSSACCDHLEHLVTQSDALVLATAWPEYLHAPWQTYYNRMPRTIPPLFIDGRNALPNPRHLSELGFKVVRIGEPFPA